MSKEAVCAIILDYRAAKKTRQCLESLANQAIKTVYILDNSGQESASAELRQTVDPILHSGPDYDIAILSAGKNLGFGKGVNFVLSYDKDSKSPHDYYLLLNNDALAGPSLVSGLIAALKQNPEVALVAPKILSHDAGREHGIWYHRYLGLLLSRPGRLRFHYFTGCCLLFSKELVGETGLFDEEFFMYGEDVELGWRLTRRGWKSLCVPNVYVQHDLGPSVDRTSFFYEYHMVRGHLLLSLRTWLHPAEIPFLVVTKYSALACRAIARCLRTRTLAPFNALLLAWFPIRLPKP